MNTSTISLRNVLATTSLVSLFACGTAPAEESADTGRSASSDDSAASELTKAGRCDGTDMFVKYGLYDDLKAAVDPKFSPKYYVDVPGSIRAFNGYGGDVVSTVPGAGASAERVFDVNPGGLFHGELGGSPDAADPASVKRFTAAKALFEAMTRSAETSKTQSGVTWTYRTSPGGRVQCEKYTYGSTSTHTCRFSDLLFVRATAVLGAIDFCPSH